jgi:hypothetical protein
MMNGPLGDQIRKEMQEDKAAASQVKRTGWSLRGRWGPEGFRI